MNFEQLQSEIKTGTVLVDFYASWCGPCKMMMPTLNELAEEGHKIVKVDIDEVPEVKEAYGIMSVPTFVTFKDGEPTKRVTGFQPKELIEDMLT